MVATRVRVTVAVTQHEVSGEAGIHAAEPLRLDDPWYDELASGRAAPPVAPGERGDASTPRRNGPAGEPTYAEPGRMAASNERAAVYLAVQRSAAFQEVRRSHRRFVFPATVGFLCWYLLYIGTTTAAPELMATTVGDGPFNLGMVAGLGQFLSTGLLTWAYVWNAGRRRDRAAFELRWDTQLRTRQAGR